MMFVFRWLQDNLPFQADISHNYAHTLPNNTPRAHALRPPAKIHISSHIPPHSQSSRSASFNANMPATRSMPLLHPISHNKTHTLPNNTHRTHAPPPSAQTCPPTGACHFSALVAPAAGVQGTRACTCVLLHTPTAHPVDLAWGCCRVRL